MYDICWTRDGNFMVSGSVDNTAIMWDINKGLLRKPVAVKLRHVCHSFSLQPSVSLGQKLCILNDHKSYVQGVTWDPLGQYIATLSCDR